MNNLKDLTICPRCQTLHKKLPLSKKEEAHCANCNARLYKNYTDLPQRALALSLAALIFFAIATTFPIIQIDFAGSFSSVNLLDAIWQLLHEGYIFMALFAFLVLFLFPLLLMGTLFIFSLLLVMKKRVFAKWVLQFMTLLSRWSMLDIFFVSILVAMVKIYEYAHIHFGLAFWAMALFVLLEIYLTRYITIEQYWDKWEEV
ncbi:paraquat-inducible protein A [Nitratiruptor sp. YY08-26]|uniref:paraquat-inducible protein A n=1 Tax=unclassified Nitratiruptor TaxID=2624044 RepID=UPI001915753C|nr:MULTISPECIES: paraquat-inducible protein A [unclassified Nitratiruptor]BCD61555.1 paraquat-inducible protein A [Nitratiruptor sp. YY08-13]BCD65489.1 paraquat-inducible protein A [Nitratiruptor sp. YY08-26]